MRAIIVGAFLLSSIQFGAAQTVTCLVGPCGIHHHRHSAHHHAPITEYRGYSGYVGPDGYRIWEGDVDPSFGSERYGENGGTVHYGD